MDLYINDMLYALSYALDCVEGELLGVKARHSERVAYMCVKTGSELGLSGCELSALAASSVVGNSHTVAPSAAACSTWASVVSSWLASAIWWRLQ